MPPSAQASPRSLDQARKWLEERGISIAEFARQHGLARATVADFLRGRTKGRRGEAHDAAVALGVKRGIRRSEAR